MKALNTNIVNDGNLFLKIIQGCEKSLEQLMDKYSEPLCNHVMLLTGSRDLSEEVVADVFISLWKVKNNLVIQTSLRSYLYRSCKNRALDVLEKEKRYQTEGIESMKPVKGDISTDTELNIKELNLHIDSLIKEMPKQKQLIFRMSRIDGLKYREIAEILSLSINTVQNHMVEAVKFMAKHKVKFD